MLWKERCWVQKLWGLEAHGETVTAVDPSLKQRRGKAGRGYSKFSSLSVVQALNSTSLWLSQLRISLQCKRHGRPRFNPWVRKIPWSRKMATQSSILAWKTPWTEKPGGLWSMGSQRVGHDWRDLALSLNQRSVPQRRLGVMFSAPRWHQTEKCKEGEWIWRQLNMEIKPGNPLGKSTLSIHCKDWRWSANILTTWCKEPTHWKRPWCWERLRVGGEGSNRGWDGWIASSTPWAWVWANSRR